MAKKRKTVTSVEAEKNPEMKKEPKQEQEPEPSNLEEKNEESEKDAESSEDSEDSGEEEEDEEDEEETSSEEEDELTTRDSLRKLLEPFAKDQLIELLKELATKDHSVISRIRKSVESDPVHRKIFVHGLGWDSTTETLMSVFKQYGSIEECNVVTDKITGRAKGYGFVLFKRRSGAQKALKEPQKKVGNRLSTCQLASFGPPSSANSKQSIDTTGRKIFVSNIAQNTNPEKLKSFFETFGEIEEGPLGIDRITGKFRGFCLFIYKTVEGCRKALEEPRKMFEGNQLHCQLGVDGLTSNKPSLGTVGTATSVLPPNDLALRFATPNLNAGIGGHNLNSTPTYGMLNPTAFSSSVPGLQASVGGLSTPLGQGGSIGLSYGPGLGSSFNGQTGINTANPSVIGNYGSQAALHGLGAYQNASSAVSRPQSGFTSLGYSSFLGR